MLDNFLVKKNQKKEVILLSSGNINLIRTQFNTEVLQTVFAQK